MLRFLSERTGVYAGCEYEPIWCKQNRILNWMISIITAVYNQFDMNRLFHESLLKYTKNPFELIIVDNASTDGSKEFFRQNGAILISTGANYSYPYCQNIGLKEAKYDYLIFLNNDVIVSPSWDERAIQIMKIHDLDVACCCATDRIETHAKTNFYKSKWGFIKKSLLTFGTSYYNLKLMHKLMYWDWERCTESRYRKFGDRVEEGFVGCNVIVTREGLEKIGLWDEKVQGADFDIFLRTKSKSIEDGDIKPIHVMLGVYIHHYIRLTAKRRVESFVDRNNLVTIEEKWGEETANRLLKDAGVHL